MEESETMESVIRRLNEVETQLLITEHKLEMLKWQLGLPPIF